MARACSMSFFRSSFFSSPLSSSRHAVFDIVQLVKDAALLDDAGPIDQRQGLAYLTTPIPDHRLQPVFRPHTAFAQTSEQSRPSGFVFPIGHLRVQDFPFAITAEPEGYQQHDLLAPSLMPFALAFVDLDGLRLDLHP